MEDEKEKPSETDAPASPQKATGKLDAPEPVKSVQEVEKPKDTEGGANGTAHLVEPEAETPKADSSESDGLEEFNRTRLIERERKTPGRDTAILSAGSSRLRRMTSGPDTPAGTTSLGEQREIIFVIRGMVERVVLRDKLSIVLGRTDPGARPTVDVDLTPYGALDRGVSRMHCRLHLEDNRIYITDLGSTNGTFVAGKRLEANQPEALRKGEELLLGRLSIQVLFR